MLKLLLAILLLLPQKSAVEKRIESLGFCDVGAMKSGILVDLMYAKADNFTHKVLYKDLRHAYLHPLAAKSLIRAQEILRKERPDLTLKVYDAARPMSIQRTMYNAVKGTSKAIYVSNPKNGGGLHNYGMAVDITLALNNGDTLDMGTKIDHLGYEAHITNEALLVERHIITKKARHNRELLRRVMRQASFRSLSTEWWHFNRITRKEARSRYRVIE